jgi:hypothetical protein
MDGPRQHSSKAAVSRSTLGRSYKQTLLKHAQENAVISSVEIPFGKKYIIDGLLSTKDGRNPIVRTIWFIEAGEEQPRFVTAYPLKGKKS